MGPLMALSPARGAHFFENDAIASVRRAFCLRCPGVMFRNPPPEPTTTTTTTNIIQMNNTSPLVGIPTRSKCNTLQYFCCLNLNPCNSFAKSSRAQNGLPRAALRPCAKPIPCRVQIDVLFEIVAPATRCPPYASPGGSPDHSAPTCNPCGRRRTWAPPGRSR